MPINRLGKGLSALLPTDGDNLVYLNTDLIGDNPYQVRTEEEIDDILDSIKKHGIIQPVVVRRKSGNYILVAGSRRLKAARIAGLAKIPCIVLDVDEKDSMKFTLIENLDRRQLNPIEEAKGYKKMMELFGITQSQLSSIFGKNRSTIANSLRLLKLHEKVQQMIVRGTVQSGHARLLIGLPSYMQVRLATLTAKNGLSVRELQKIINESKKSNRKKISRIKYINLRSDVIGKNVYLRKNRNGSGSVILKFKDEQEFQLIKSILKLGGK